MAHTFLRSGNLDAVLPLGENGQPVWLSALQIRETLRLRQQPALVNLLAIPQINEAGNRLDWYAPYAGKVVTWNNASEAVRAQALDQIEHAEAALREISEKALASSKASHKLSGALLTKVLQIPDQHYLYLVDDQPVITFWGFTSLNKKPQNILELLRTSRVCDDEPLNLPLSASAAVSPSFQPFAESLADTARSAELPAALNSRSAEQQPLVYERPLAQKYPEAKVTTSPEGETQSLPAEAQPVINTVSASTTSVRLSWKYAWLLPGIVLITVLVSRMHSEASRPGTAAESARVQSAESARQAQETPPTEAQPPVSMPTAQPVNNAAPPAAEPELASGQQIAVASPQSVNNATPPATKAELPESASGQQIAAAPVQPVNNASPSLGVTEPVATVSVEKGDLVLPAVAVRLGSTKFLNGTWHAVLNIRIPITGKPPALRYQLYNGKGNVRLIQGDGATCRADVYAGLMKSGNLVINTRTRAKCSDGTRLAIPEVTCVQGSSGPAQCTARYDENTAYPMTLKRKEK